MNETQEYMAKLGELCTELNRARDKEMAAQGKVLAAQSKLTDAMVARHNAEQAYHQHLCNRPGREPGRPTHLIC